MKINNDTETAQGPGAAAEALSEQTGKRFWRSLDEWAETAEFRELIGRQFPSQIEVALDPVTRRTFLKVMGASLAFAGVSGCAPRQPDEHIMPFAANVPQGMVAGRPALYATAIPDSGYGVGLLVESNMGRPTKIEGNPMHPASLGAASAIHQASVLSLYDPDRSQNVMQNGRVSTWDNFLSAMLTERNRHRANGGVGLRFLTGPVTSPTLARQMRTLLTADHFPSARWYTYEPVGHSAARAASRSALGGDFDTVYNFERAEVVVSLDSNFLLEGPGALTYARQYGARRRVVDGQKRIHRHYAVESTPTLTGASADHRLRLRPSHVEAAVRAIAQGIGVGVPQGQLDAHAQAFVATVVKDLQANRGASVVIPGDCQPPIVHELAHAINQALGNVGATVSHVPTLEANPADGLASIAELAREMHEGRVDTLVIFGANPLYDAPVDLGFKEALEKVRLRVHLGEYWDETGLWCHWHVPQAHYLESWGDVLAFDGTATIVQPLIAPLFEGRTGHEVLAALLGQGTRSAYDIVREHWTSQMAPGSTPDQFDVFWRQALNDGRFTPPPPQPIPGLPAPAAAPPAPATIDAARFAAAPAPAAASGMEIAFRPDPSLWDGRYANNGWLQELPKPLTKLTWDNAAVMNIRDANRLGVTNESVVRLTYQGRSVDAPVRVLAGHPEGCVTVHLGFGRQRAGRVGTGVGFNAYALRTSDAPWHGAGLQIAATGDTYALGITEHHNMISAGTQPPVAGSLQDHYNNDNDVIGTGPGYVDGTRGRGVVKVDTFERYLANEDVFREGASGHTEAGMANAPDTHDESLGGQHETNTDASGHPASVDTLIPGDANHSFLEEQFHYDGNRWAMSIDTQSCIGCNACVVACQSENNIPVVGKEQVLVNREMHWIRIDTYFRGNVDDPESYFMPVPCQQCENAPCEVVCPVGATVHSEEGLNDMVYNRCIGTRYCSNNCPYKVRRYNFLKYSDQSPLAQLRSNPNVTIRARGVMEKCTYCVQRIWRARIESHKADNRPIADGEIQTACQQTCPTQAIVFGNLNDPNSKVSALKQSKLMYGLLAELTTRPRTTYLARLRNPNPELEKA